MPTILSTPGRLASFTSRRKAIRLALVTGVVGLLVLAQLGGRAQGHVGPADDATISAYIAHQLADSGIPGGAIAIVRNGQVSRVEGFGVADASGRPITTQTPFVLGSLSKSFTALAVMQLVEAAPGAAYAYSNANYEVLGALIERVSGEPYGQYIEDHIFEPLRMSHAHADLASAEADGLTAAHRLWFGLSHDSAPLWRPDFLPAGWLTASAQDMAHFLVAQLDGGSYAGTEVASTASIQLMQSGEVTMGPLTTGRYGLGWVDTSLGGVRVVGHTGSTTDMASAIFFAPGRGLGLVLLLNGQSTLYELLHKPDSIAEAAFQQMLGQAPQGTIELFYPVFDAFVIALFGTLWYRLLRPIQRVRRGQSTTPRLFGRRLPGVVLAVWLNVVVPLAILLNAPGFLGAPWTVLVRIDVGLVLFAFAATRIVTGLVLLAGQHWLQRDARSLGLAR